MSSSQKKSLLKKKRSNKILKEKEISPKFKTSPKIKIGQWDEDEDDILNQWVKENGPKNWAKCAKLIKCRTGKQCREHWKNKLNEDIKKGQWTPEDDLLILKFYNKYQSWKQIIPIFDSRTENSIKNRFFSLLRKIAIKKKTFGKTNEVAKMKIDSLKRFLEEAMIIVMRVKYHDYNYTLNPGVIEKLRGTLSELAGLEYSGYEIHMGRSSVVYADTKEYSKLSEDAKTERITQTPEIPVILNSGNVYGTYVHGIFDHAGIASSIIKALSLKKGVEYSPKDIDLESYKEKEYDRLSEIIRDHMDMDAIKEILGL